MIQQYPLFFMIQKLIKFSLFSGLMVKCKRKWRLHGRKLSASTGSSRRDPTRKFSVISVHGMEGIYHRGLISESGTRGLRRLEVVRNRKVQVDQAQVQQTLNECVNHFNKVPENQFDAHPEKWEYQTPLYTGFSIKD